MKHIYTFVFVMAALAGVSQSRVPVELRTRAVKMDKYLPMQAELSADPAYMLGNPPERQPSMASGNRDLTEWIIGSSYYDLQSNGSVQNRIVKNGNSIAGVWTQSFQTANFTDRGTGYNATDNGNWPDVPTERLESVRTGWPSLLQLANGKEVIISHNAPVGLRMLTRNSWGEDWQESAINSVVPEGILWPRAVSGGADGNTIHMVAISTPAANQTQNPPVTYQGLNGAIVYWRSEDGGSTWDISDYVIPGMDATQFVGFRGDTYAIHARGNKVAIAVFNSFADSFVMISEDNGDTWTKEIMVDCPVDLYTGDDEIIDIDNDMVADTLYNTDNSGALFIGSDNTVHICWGNMRYTDDALGDDQWSYFPYTDGLAYWQAGWAADNYEEIAFLQDLDGDEMLGLLEDFGAYFVSMTGMPQIGEDEEGNLYVSYTAVVESHATSTQNYRHLHIIKSTDGGATWSDPVDVTPDEDFDGYEVSYPSMAPNVDDYVHIIYQRDFEPGLAVRGDMDSADLNDMMYFRITTDLDNTIVNSVSESISIGNVTVFPNPAENILNIMAAESIESLQIFDISGKRVIDISPRTAERVTVDISTLTAGVYFASVNGEKIRFVKQ